MENVLAPSLEGSGEALREKSKIPRNVLKGLEMGEGDAERREVGNIR